MKKLAIGLMCLVATSAACADPLQNFYAGAYGGYGGMSGTAESSGDFTQGQFALGYQQMLTNHPRVTLGGEFGVQSGNSLSLGGNPTPGGAGIPLNATLKPLFDFLADAKYQLSPRFPLFGLVKFGFAYRQLNLTGVSSASDIANTVAPELEAGFGYNITQHAMITTFYQGIYADSTAHVGIDSSGNPTINNVPTQQAGFIGLEYSF